MNRDRRCLHRAGQLRFGGHGGDGLGLVLEQEVTFPEVAERFRWV